MNSFNDLNGIPATANKYLQRDILKGAWKFKGFVVSDWGSVGEMINHGYAKDNYEAAMQAANAGSDMDMESRSYIQNLSRLVKEGTGSCLLLLTSPKEYESSLQNIDCYIFGVMNVQRRGVIKGAGDLEQVEHAAGLF